MSKPGEENNSGTDALDTEGNLFETIHDNIEDEDDDDLLGDEMKSFEDYEAEEEDEAEDEDEEEEEDPLFENEEEEEESEEEADIEDFNKKLGTNFKTIDELKESLKKTDEISEKEKEDAEYRTLNNKVILYDKYIGMDNEELIRNQLLTQARQEKKDIEDKDVLDDIEEQIQGLKDLRQLDSMAETLRSNLQNQKEKVVQSIEKIDSKREKTEQEIARKNRDNLQTVLADIFDKKEFFGVTVTKEDIQDVYKDITTNKFFDSVNGNQEVIAQLALFLKYREQISTITNKPTHSDKLKDEFNTLLGNKGKAQRRSIATAKGSASQGSAEENLLGFLK